MDIDNLVFFLNQVKEGTISVAEALERLRLLPYEDLGMAQIDHHRALRKGFPEVIFCPGKTVEQVVVIAGAILERGRVFLATRATEEMFQALSSLYPEARYNSLARTIVVNHQAKEPTQGLVLIVSAGTADAPVAEEAYETARVLGSRVEKLYDVGVAGVHRLLDRKALLYQARVLVVVAGMEGALASVVGGLVDKPVIAVPTSVGYGASFGGVAALLSMLNTCAPGVSTVNIDNGFGAGYMAHMINILGEQKVQASSYHKEQSAR